MIHPWHNSLSTRLTSRHNSCLDTIHSCHNSLSTRLTSRHDSHLDSLPRTYVCYRQLLLDCGIGVTSTQPNSIDGVVNQHRALIFCQLTMMLDIIENELLRFVGVCQVLNVSEFLCSFSSPSCIYFNVPIQEVIAVSHLPQARWLDTFQQPVHCSQQVTSPLRPMAFIIPMSQHSSYNPSVGLTMIRPSMYCY